MDLVMSVRDEIHVLDFGHVIASTPGEIRANRRACRRPTLGQADEEPVGETTLIDPITTEIPAVQS